MDPYWLLLYLFSVGQAGEKAAGPIERAGPGEGEKGLYHYRSGTHGAGIANLHVAEHLPANLFVRFVGHAPLAGSGEGRRVEGVGGASPGDHGRGDASA